MEKKDIGSEQARVNCMVSQYSDIAVENYRNAVLLYKEMDKVHFKEMMLQEQYQIFYQKVVISAVFSAMAIEAFINNYAAACLGDNFFYENFDRLSIIGKLQLISKFLFEKEVDKGKEYYYCLKTTFSLRDKLVHSKSSSLYDFITSKGYILHEDEEDAQQRDGVECIEAFAFDKEELKADLNQARTAINAMKKIAEYFDENDSGIHAMLFFFHIGNTYSDKYKIYYDTYREFGLV